MTQTDYYFQTEADGSKTLFRVLPDGTNRVVSTDYHGYVEYLAAGFTATVNAYIAPATVITYIPVKTIFERIESLGKTDAVWAALTTAQQIKFLTLQQGIVVDDADVTALLTSLSIDPTAVLYV